MSTRVNVAEHWDVRHVATDKYTADGFNAMLETAEGIRPELVSWHDDYHTSFELDRDELGWLMNNGDAELSAWALELLGLGDPDNDFIRVDIY